jgi:hypothetical protein
MSVFRRLLSAATASAAALSVVIPTGLVAPAAADPCSVSAPVAPSAAPTLPSLPKLPKFPILHLPIGRKPAFLNGGESAKARAEAAKADAAVAPETTAQAAESPEASTASIVDWLTGPNTDSYSRFGISGTDLGIMWDNGSTSNSQLLIAFGDTFGNCSLSDQEWRKNTLFRSGDRDLSNGMSIPATRFGDIHAGSPVTEERPNFSRQVIASLNLAAQEVTVIPTAGISVGATQYVNFMSVAQWGAPGQWSTNFSAVAVSNDNGENWSVPRESIRPAWFNSVPGVPFVWGYQNFQMGAYLRHNGYVYAYGTGAGRGGMPFLSRVPENSVPNLSAYEYFTPFGWRRGMPYFAVQVVWAPGSEMSVAWNDHLRKFVMLYTNTASSVVMRTADKPEGPWSSAKTIITSTQLPGGLYAPYIHPWSTGNNLYFTLSLWSNYSVMLMRTTLSPN